MKSPLAASSGPDAPRKVWSAGTLTYSLGALVVLFCWMLWGDFAWQLKERAAPPVVQLMLRKFQASDLLTGLFLLSLPAAIGVVLGPIISYRSDRHRGSWGRRIPYLLITSPIATLAMYLLAFSPWIGTWLHTHMGWAPDKLNLTIIVVLGLSWTVFEFATVAANAVFGGLINDVVPRELIGRFFGMFRAVSLGTGMIFNFYLIGHAKEYFMPILVGIGTLYGVGVGLMCFMVKEGEYPPVRREGSGGVAGLLEAVKSYGRDCFSHPYYLWVFASMALAALAFVPVNLFSVYAAESFGQSMTLYGRYIVVTYACSLVFAYPLGWLADRFHATRVGIAALAAYAVVMAVGYFWIDGPTSFGTVFLLHGVLSGCYFTGAAALGQMLFPKMKFAQFASAGGMILALANVAFGPLLGLLLDWLGHDYRYTFGMGCLISMLALLASILVYRRFMALGGPQGYVAPE
ncbi:MAG: MFS transporter [Cephaloticoccus sp.]|nr:MFS transporter [Cephaloticoccus sp.]MCF7760803.1 MFS transporter [Cephaloticoccus sp.]